MQVRPTTAAMLGFKGPWTGLLHPKPTSAMGSCTWRRLGGLPMGMCAEPYEVQGGARGGAHDDPLGLVLPSGPRAPRGAWLVLRHVDLPQVSATPLRNWDAVPSTRESQSGAQRERVRRQQARMKELWAAHAARVRAIEAKIDRIMERR